MNFSYIPWIEYVCEFLLGFFFTPLFSALVIEFKIRSFIYGSVRVCMDACMTEEECAHEAMQKCKDSNVEKLNEKEIEK